MTDRTGVIGLGVRASAAASSARQRTGAIRIGLLVAASSPSWAGRARQVRSNNWMLRADVPWFDPRTGRPTPAFFQFMYEIAENRLGGVNGASIPTVQTTVTQTQAEVVATGTYAQSVSAYAQGIAATATATAQVTQNNGLTGSDSIPPPPVPPSPPSGTQAV